MSYRSVVGSREQKSEYISIRLNFFYFFLRTVYCTTDISQEMDSETLVSWSANKVLKMGGVCFLLKLTLRSRNLHLGFFCFFLASILHLYTESGNMSVYFGRKKNQDTHTLTQKGSKSGCSLQATRLVRKTANLHPATSTKSGVSELALLVCVNA